MLDTGWIPKNSFQNFDIHTSDMRKINLSKV
jgi:hypothetical protein